PADVEALAPAKPDASGDSASRAQDAGAVRADRPRGDDVLDGEGDAVLDEGAPRVGRAGAGVSPVVGRGNRVGVNRTGRQGCRDGQYDAEHACGGPAAAGKTSKRYPPVSQRTEAYNAAHGRGRATRALTRPRWFA